ncbi:MAG: T9SS type A sorting domain-containing protein [Bacteroidales bacterium]|nr:T9SS type A sorting domain-containing protein [Bacteroidales bacterium]
MKKNFIFLVFIYTLFLICLNNGPANAQWTPIGPEGGFINCMTKSGNTLYALTGFYFTVSQLYSSTDDGLHWEKIESESFPIADVFGMTSVGNSLFISSDGIYRSDDNGHTWVKKYNMGAGLLTANSTTVYAAIQNQGILHSSDNGENWTLSNNGLTDLWFYSMTANETSVFVGTGDNNEGVFRSTDNGANWQQVSNGFAYYYNGNWIPNMAPMISSLAFIGNDLYAGTQENQGIWKSTNNGDYWEFTSMETMNYTNITSFTGNEAMVLAGTGLGGVLKSIDGGATWSESNAGIAIYGNVTTLKMDNGNIYVGTMGGIYKSDDNGNNWRSSYSGIKALIITYPGFALLGDDLYVGSGYSGIFHTADEGTTWNDVNEGLPVNEWTLNNLYANETALFAWDRVSFDGGASWEMRNDYSPGSVFFEYNGPGWLEHGNAWFAINSYDNAGVYRSTDNGQNWSTINNGIPNPESTFFYSIHSKGTTLFLGTSTGFYYSNDNGDSWQKGTFPDLFYWSLLGASYLSTETVDVCGLIGGGGSKGIYRSTDNGDTWTKVSDLLTHKFVTAGNTIFASVMNPELVNGEMVDVPRIFKSQDNGQSWTNTSESINISLNSLASDGSNIFIAQNTSGNSAIYISKDEGDNWVEISDGLSPTIYTSSFFIHNNKIYAATVSSSVWARNISEFVAPTQPSLIVGSETPCIGSSQTYSVTNVPGVTYTWQFPSDWVITGGNGTHSVTVTVGNTAGVILVIPSNAFGFGPAQILVTNPVSTIDASVSIEADQNNICEGSQVSITATPTEGGDSPVYQWFVNGIENGESGAVLTYLPANNDEVYALLTSSLECVTNDSVQSNTLHLLVTIAADVDVSITADKNNVCAGETITFTASTTNGGAQPTYEWYVNETKLGENLPDFSYVPQNGDFISLRFTSDEWCVLQNPVTSNAIVAIVKVLPDVSWTSVAYDTLCINWLPVNLSGGLPAGGTYSGDGVTNNVFDPSAAGAGDHAITYTWSDGNDCTNSASITLSVNNCLGIDELSSATLVYPNPATDRITIVLTDNRVIGEIALFNLMGTKVFEKSSINVSGLVTIPVQDIPSGNYIIRITGNNESIVKPIILK